MAAPTASAPLVSVVLAFLDEECFLAGAIDTVRAQHGGRWELLLVDDGSTDGSPAIADDAATADPARVRVLRHPGGGNAGLPASRNLGLAAATAPFVCFLDADDRWEPQKLDRQRALLDEQPAAVMVCGPSWRVPLDSPRPAAPVAVSRHAPCLLRRGRFPRLIVRGAVRTPAPSDVMYRTSTLRALGGVPAGPTMHEDQRTYVAVGLAGAVFVSDEPLSTYTTRTDSVYGAVASGGDDMLVVRQHLDFERWVAGYARGRGGYGLALLGALLSRKVQRGVARRARLAWSKRPWRAGGAASA